MEDTQYVKLFDNLTVTGPIGYLRTYITSLLPYQIVNVIKTISDPSNIPRAFFLFALAVTDNTRLRPPKNREQKVIYMTSYMYILVI